MLPVLLVGDKEWEGIKIGEDKQDVVGDGE